MNTLNNLYSLVYQGSKQSGEAILKLSDLMRYMLYDTHSDKVSLENEIKYLHSFIELQMLRLSNKELVDFQISGDPTGKLIAPMLLIPFVENAFKHGNKNLPGMGITIRLNIDNKNLIFEVENIKASKSVQKISESGIGLMNIQKRLELQYPGKHQLLITDTIDHFFILLKLTL
jgi:LytS/YehU family sensor histidine kinase